MYQCSSFASSQKKMDSMRTFDSEATLTVCEGYDVTEETRAFKKRCNFSCWNCFRRRCSFRVCQIFLFLFLIVIIIPGLGLVVFRTGRTESSRGRDLHSTAGKWSPFIQEPVFVEYSSVTKQKVDLVLPSRFTKTRTEMQLRSQAPWRILFTCSACFEKCLCYVSLYCFNKRSNNDS